MLNKRCPRCSGKMYADLSASAEATCINCGYIDYSSGILTEAEVIATGTYREKLFGLPARVVEKQEITLF